MRIILLGPPGVGKGTQGRRLAVVRGWPLISTGEMLRDAIATGSPLGKEAGQLMAAGHLVPDDVMIGLVRERTARPDAATGYVLDGFPRTVPQAQALDTLLTERGMAVDMVLCLTAPEDELVRRLTARRECPVCKRAYNLVSAPPRVDERCDDHPDTKLVQRDDDGEETIRHRLDVYVVQTQPLVDYYRTRGRLVEVKGTGTEERVQESIRQALNGTTVGER